MNFLLFLRFIRQACRCKQGSLHSGITRSCCYQIGISMASLSAWYYENDWLDGWSHEGIGRYNWAGRHRHADIARRMHSATAPSFIGRSGECKWSVLHKLCPAISNIFTSSTTKNSNDSRLSNRIGMIKFLIGRLGSPSHVCHFGFECFSWYNSIIVNKHHRDKSNNKQLIICADLHINRIL